MQLFTSSARLATAFALAGLVVCLMAGDVSASRPAQSGVHEPGVIAVAPQPAAGADVESLRRATLANDDAAGEMLLARHPYPGVRVGVGYGGVGVRYGVGGYYGRYGISPRFGYWSDATPTYTIGRTIPRSITGTTALIDRASTPIARSITRCRATACTTRPPFPPVPEPRSTAAAITGRPAPE